MGGFWTYGNSISGAPIDYPAIFGANYYDHWRPWNAASLTITSPPLVDAIASLTGSGRSFSTSVATSRPTLLLDGAIGKNVLDFDGVNEFLRVLSSSTDYNFLHDGSGGCVVVVAKPDTSATGIVLRNFSGSTDVGFSEVVISNSYNTAVARGVSGAFTLVNNSGSGAASGSYFSKVSVYDADNGTAADRSEVYLSGGVAIKNNVLTNAPSVTNATSNLTMGVLPPLNISFPFDGKIAEVIIINTIPTPTQLAAVQARLEYDYTTFPIT